MNFLEKKVINSLLPKAKDYLADFVKMAIEQSNTIPLQGDEKQHAVLLFENQGEPMWGIVTLGQKNGNYQNPPKRQNKRFSYSRNAG